MKFNLNLNDIKYIKILYKDKNENPTTVKAAIKSVSEKEIIACAKSEEPLLMPIPQEVTLSIVCSDGLYRTKTKLKYIDNADPYTFFSIESPQGMEYQQNREYFRVSADYKCKYTISSEDKIKEFTTHICDISANGVSLIMPVHEISSEDASLEIFFGEVSIYTRVKFIRSEKIDDGYKLSFTYTGISNLDRDFISQVCIKKQLEQRRHSMN